MDQEVAGIGGYGGWPFGAAIQERGGQRHQFREQEKGQEVPAKVLRALHGVVRQHVLSASTT